MYRESSHGTPQGRGEEVGHETPYKETQKGKQETQGRDTKRMAMDRKQTAAFLGQWPMVPASKQVQASKEGVH